MTEQPTCAPVLGSDLIARTVSTYLRIADVTGSTCALGQFFDAIRSGTWREQVTEIRQMFPRGEAKACIDEKTALLPSITATGVFVPSRKKENMAMFSGCTAGVIGDLPGMEVAAGYRDKLAEDKYVLACFLSPSGLGVEVIFYIGNCADAIEYQAAWQALANYLFASYGLKLDPAGKDVCRACYGSWDPDIKVHTGEIVPFTERMAIVTDRTDSPLNESAAAGADAVSQPSKVNTLPLLERAGTYSGTIVRADKRKASNGHEFVHCRVETPHGWTTVDIWLTTKAMPWSVKRVGDLGLGKDSLNDPALLVGVACTVEVTGTLGKDGKTWWSGELPLPPIHITPVERAELCRRVDLPSLLEADGVEVKPCGPKYVCRLRRDDRTPSCHIWPPGVGAKGFDGWTLHDYGDGWGGDALTYLVEKRGMQFVDAVAELCRLAGWTPPSLEYLAPNRRVNESKRVPHTIPPMPIPVASMAPEDQAAAVALFLSTLCQMYPEACAEGDAYLEGRGVLPPNYPPGTAFRLPGYLCAPLAERLTSDPNVELLLKSGLLKTGESGKPPRLPWWGDVVLFACRDTRAWLVYLVGRRLEWKEGDVCGKYINQLTPEGGSVRWPFNLPAAYAAAGRLPGWPWKPSKDHADELLLVEGPADALGAACLGWAAVALCMRLQTRDWKNREGAVARMLDPHMNVLRDLRLVRVVPDNDSGDKGVIGMQLASKLVGYLRAAGVAADVSLMGDLYPDHAKDCKDLADVAAKSKGN